MNTFTVQLRVTKPLEAFSKCPAGTPGRVLSRRLQRRALTTIRKTRNATRATSPRMTFLTKQHPATTTSYKTTRFLPALPQLRHIHSPYNELSDPIGNKTPLHEPDDDAIGGPPDHPYAITASEAKRRLLSALHHRSPDALIESFIAISQHRGLIESLPRTTFREIFNILDPAYFVVPFRDAQFDFSLTQAASNGVKPMRDVFEKFRHVLRSVSVIRREAGVRFTVGDYAYLLKCARVAGNGDGARSIWKDMKEEGIKPSTECCNHYLGAVVWSGAYESGRMKWRNTPVNLELRASSTPPKGFEKVKVGHRGIREEAMQTFDYMVAQGGLGDEETFAMLVIAMGREADMTGIQSILKHLWNIDVEGLNEGKEEDLEPVRRHAPGSSMNPSTELLFAVAHAYGTNNDIPTALMLVDVISRQYQVSIPLAVWEQLFEWTFVLSSPRYNSRRQDGTTTGQLPPASVESLWNTMTSPPYNLEVSTPMLNRYMKNLWRRGIWHPTKQGLEEGHRRYLESARQYRAARQRYLLARSLASKGRPPLRAEFNLDHLNRQQELARIVEARDRSYMKRWVRFLLGGGGGGMYSAGPNREFERCEIPNLIDRYRGFTPPVIMYGIRGTGLISINDWPTTTQHD